MIYLYHRQSVCTRKLWAEDDISILCSLHNANCAHGRYCVALLAMGVHLYLGWSKAVHKMQLDKAHGTARFMHPVRSFGHACAVAVTVGFLACVLWARYQSSLLHE